MSEGLSYTFTEEQRAFRDSVRQLVEDKVAPRAAEIDEADEYPWDVDELFVKNGFAGVSYPEEFGGAGGGAVELCILVEEISRVSAGVALIPAVNKLGAIPILLAGSDDMRKRVFTGITNGDHRMSYCLTEPNSGSDAGAMRSRAARDGDHWVLSGSKRFITGAGASDLYTYFAVSDPDAPKGKNITAFLVDKDMDGFSLGRKEDKMGIRGSPTREVMLENVRVPEENVIGDVNGGFQIAMRTLDFSRPTVAAQALGIAQGAFDFAVGYCNEREQFGKRIATFQGMQFMFADMAMKIETARMAVYRAAVAVDEGAKDVSYWAAIAKCYASDVAMDVTTDCVQALGGYGYIREYPVERFMRDAKITQIYEGTNQIQRVVIARSIFGGKGR
ncbi:MAG TPA: acyl-CoA dehydrogenase family protein [Actinomycetota bacterium]|nr:acyl-CoA dehydrogenase family protein [Actinomycetota bacterium]